ncbi:TIGR01777 family oxidoreductase [Nakamurella aerolata]|uniref:TIGR01777 family protein n=1 Tax=Nakamurella aerolata TaxID=1656892 RepID=A0A849AFL6_9ACTN|nr:TIGR01777 family oxidoreductase [Nakamurella aerolata]NNG35632.1 TIGR01777 family protein [Nakamurella aerolata]
MSPSPEVPASTEHTATFSAEIPESRDRLWTWLGRPGAAVRLTPPWQPISVRHEAADLRDGVARLRVGGLPWTATHQPDGYVEGSRFTDELTTQPLDRVLQWRHQHELADGPTGSVTMIDRLSTRVPKAMLRSVFDFRARQLTGDLAAHRRWSQRPLTIAVTGASGLIGTALSALLGGGGHRVIRLARPGQRPAEPPPGALRHEFRDWQPDRPDPAVLSGVDAVVHLAGAGILGRFTPAHRQALRASRIGPTGALARAANDAGVTTFVQASAIGYYGADASPAGAAATELTETAPAGDDFLARLVRDWEADGAQALAGTDTRHVAVRTGLVLTPAGGLLRPLRPLFTAGLGGRIGDGGQWMSWIGIDDLVDVYLRAVTDTSLSGPLNAVAPNPVTNKAFTEIFGRVLHRPTLLPVPALGPRLLLGQQATEEFVLASQRVAPAALTAANHPWRHPELTAALAHLLGKTDTGDPS